MFPEDSEETTTKKNSMTIACFPKTVRKQQKKLNDYSMFPEDSEETTKKKNSMTMACFQAEIPTRDLPITYKNASHPTATFGTLPICYKDETVRLVSILACNQK
jgi:hypothetical protein